MILTTWFILETTSRFWCPIFTEDESEAIRRLKEELEAPQTWLPSSAFWVDGGSGTLFCLGKSHHEVMNQMVGSWVEDWIDGESKRPGRAKEKTRVGRIIEENPGENTSRNETVSSCLIWQRWQLRGWQQFFSYCHLRMKWLNCRKISMLRERRQWKFASCLRRFSRSSLWNPWFCCYFFHRRVFGPEQSVEANGQQLRPGSWK